MRCVVYDRFGDPAEVLHLGERPVPEPGPGEIRVRLTLSPIHNHDLSTIRGEYGYKPPLPAVGGTEALGVVDAHGPDVSAPALGQRVTMAGLANAWAEYFVAPARGAVPVPDTVSDEIACQLCAMPLSALMALEDFALQPGQWMIQNAATGAVGKTLAMIAKARGVRVVNLVRREAGVAELAALGVGDAVSTSEAGWQAKVKAITGGAPIVAGLDSVGGEESGQMLHILAEGGHLMTFGAMAGKPMVLNPGDLIFKQAKVTGFWVAKRTGDRDKVGRMIGDLVRMAASGELKLPVEQAFPLAEAAAAARASAQPGRTGKIALKP
ncbi:MAG TPA: zinc-binding dehydrogenase [Roseiarcus sp.]|jgi:NADPH:quinone reductase-like Zn-dependent oxidoreductase